MNYAAGVWGFQEQTSMQVLQNRIQRFYMGVHTFAPVSATHLEFDWMDTKYKCWVEMVRLLNRIKDMKENRLPKLVLRWDASLRANGWADNIRHILDYANMNVDILSEETVDLDALTSRLLRLNRTKWLLEAQTKTKLRTFLEVYDDNNPRSIINANLSRGQRSVLSKFKLGVLPLAIETGRWKDIPLEKRLCAVCNENCLENEYHFLLFCDGYKETRTKMFQEIVDKTDVNAVGTEAQILKALLSSEAVKITAKYSEIMFQERKDILFEQAREVKRRMREEKSESESENSCDSGE